MGKLAFTAKYKGNSMNLTTKYTENDSKIVTIHQPPSKKKRNRARTRARKKKCLKTFGTKPQGVKFLSPSIHSFRYTLLHAFRVSHLHTHLGARGFCLSTGSRHLFRARV